MLDFAFDHARHRAAAADLRPEHIADFQRLVKTLRYGSRFQLLIVEFTDVPYRDALIKDVDDVLAVSGFRTRRVVLTTTAYGGFADAEAEIRRLVADGCQAVHVLGGESWFDESGWKAFNIRREAIAQSVPVRLLLWLTTEPIRQLAILAPDLWAWRAGVFSFAPTSVLLQETPVPQIGPVDPRTLAERGKRIAALRTFCVADPPPTDDVRAPLLDELATLLESIGELDEALRIRREEQLPVYERLGDVRERAVTLGKIADVLQARGELDEALRIRREEQLTVYERLGDVRERAVGRTKLAINLIKRGRTEDRPEATRLLEMALADARQMRIPEAAVIEQWIAWADGQS